MSAAASRLAPGARLANRSGKQITVLETGLDWAGRNDGVLIRYELTGRTRTLPARSLRSFQPVGDLARRDARVASLNERAAALLNKLGGSEAGATVFAARLEAGEPCVQLTLTEASFDQLWALAESYEPASALRDLLDADD
jgi:hypothetical protein